MQSMIWVLRAFSGIETDGVKISLGASRGLLRKRMASRFQPPQKNEAYHDEDDFVTQDNSTFIRVRYKNGAVWDIEFLQGQLRHDEVDLHAQTTLDEVRRHFNSKATPLRPTEWLGDGWDCVKLGINIASREDIGGEGNEIEWVILSLSFKD